eukprot:7658275-Pyramimonas_sp.AAC.1
MSQATSPMAEWVARGTDIARAEGFPFSERDAGALSAAAVEHLLEGADLLNQSQGTREHIPGVGTNRRGLAAASCLKHDARVIYLVGIIEELLYTIK